MVILSASFLIIFLSSQNFAFAENLSDVSTLQLVHVIFRHGDRTPQINERYPKDPYLQKTYYPFGDGHLTNVGKKKEFDIGTALRKKYGTFLGPYYHPENVDAWSSDYVRTKMSLQLVLAGLFPPVNDQIWNTEIKWQPVAYNYSPKYRDPLLLGLFCPNFINITEKFLATKEYQDSISKYNEDLEYIANNTGISNINMERVYDLYFGLIIEQQLGLTLPEWTKNVWPKLITEIAVRQYNDYMGTPALCRMATGYFYQKIINDTHNKIENKDKPTLYLYSAHENNIAQALMALEVFGPHVPPYGSYITFEVHKINDIYGFKTFYQNYTSEEPVLLVPPQCGSFCPLKKFDAILEKFLPNPDECGLSHI